MRCAGRWRRIGTAGLVLSGAALHVPAAASAPAETTYIVVLDEPDTARAEEVAEAADAVAAAVGEQVDGVFTHAVDGFTVTASPAEAAAIAGDARVRSVEPDGPVSIQVQAPSSGIRRVYGASNRALDIDGVDDARVDVDVAVIDTGVDVQHPDLVVGGTVDCTVAGPLSGCSAGGDDVQFHGTHVAGIVGALDNGIGVVGVAPGARMWGVRVLDASGNGLISSVIRGVDWVTANAGTIEVVNLSLTGPGTSPALYAAIQGAVDAGVAVAVAAGNADSEASGFVPAAFDNVITVSGLADYDGRPGALASPACGADQDDTLLDISNWGAVDIVAPGACIESTVPIERGSYGVLTGTSMASPHVAGALALLAQSNNPSNATDVGAMYDRVIAEGNRNWTDDSGDGVTEPLLDLASPALFTALPVPPCAAVVSGVIGWWRGEGSPTATVGPSLAGAAASSPAAVGSGVDLDGTSSLATATVPSPATGLSFDAWVRTTDWWGVQTIVSRWQAPDGPDGTRAYALMLSPGGRLIWTVDDTSALRPFEMNVAVPGLDDGAFHHIAVTWSPISASAYVDGVVVASAASQGGTPATAAGTPFVLGAKSGIGDPFWFRGTIDEPTLWSRALTPGEVSAIHAAGPAGKCLG